MDLERIKSSVEWDIQQADSYYENTIEPSVIERWQVYKADKDYYAEKFAKLSQKTDLVSYDFYSVVEWYVANAMQAFFGGDNERLVTITGVGPEDVERAKTFRKLIAHQLMRQNKGYTIAEAWFRDAFVGNLGVVKAWWDRQVTPGPTQEAIVPREQLVPFAQGKADLQVYDLPVSDLVKLEWRDPVMKRNQLVWQNVPHDEIRILPDSRGIADTPFVAHRTVCLVDDLLRKQKSGVYENVDLAVDKLGSVDYPYLMSVFTNVTDYTEANFERGRRHVVLYETYPKLDINDDGLLEDCIVTYCNGEILRAIENPWQRHPFFFLMPVPDPHKLWPDKGMAEIVGEIQHMNTALYRQLLINIALNNDPRTFVNDTQVNVADLKGDKQYIRCHGDPRAAMAPVPVQPLAAWTVPFLESMEGKLETWSGRTRYNQGSDFKSLNKTATGITTIFNASMLRMESFVRNFSESGVGDLLRFIVRLDQQYIDQPQAFRILGEPLQVTPDDLKGEYDIEVNANGGLTQKEQKIQNLQLYLGMLYGQGRSQGILTPQNWIHAARELITTVGFRDVDSFCPQTMPMGGMMNGGFPGIPGQPPGGDAPGGSGGGGQALPPALAGKFPKGAFRPPMPAGNA